MNTFKPIVLLDVDGVIANLLKSLLCEINKQTGLKLTEKDVTDWDIFECLNHTNYDIKSICLNCFSQPGFAYNLEPYEYAVESIATLQTMADVYILTMPFDSPTWVADRTRWLKEHFNISPDKIIYAHDKCMINGDIFIDDRPYFVESWKKTHPNGLALLWDQPYNKLCETTSRIDSWPSLLEIVKRLHIF